MINIEEIIEENAHHFLEGLKIEYTDDKNALHIIRLYIKNGKITEQEEVILKTQLLDTLKIVGIDIPFILLPGASIILPILIKVASKYNIQLIPSAFEH
ncbi:hypothetical protein [Empedobacter brevis]|uniref:hypothetical protein n=1 Tax=Empedobacter brevis TaxID=247 RepID=UPI0039AFA374